MLNHWAVDACAGSDIAHSRSTADAQKTFHSSADKNGRAQKAIFAKRSFLSCRSTVPGPADNTLRNEIDLRLDSLSEGKYEAGSYIIDQFRLTILEQRPTIRYGDPWEMIDSQRRLTYPRRRHTFIMGFLMTAIWGSETYSALSFFGQTDRSVRWTNTATSLR